MASGEEIGVFLRSFLLYDKVVIPTVDLVIVPLLALWVGPQNLIRALDQKDVQLVRYRGSLGYLGNGHGLSMFEIRSNPDGKVQNYHDLTWAQADQALSVHIEWFAERTPPELKADWSKIQRLALENLIETSHGEFIPVAEATYRDILSNPYLESYFAIRNKNLKYLHGVGPDQVRWLLADRMNDDVDFLLHLAQFNFESYLADKTGSTDQTAGPAARYILQARAERILQSRVLARGFTQVLNLTRVPDLSMAAEDDALLDRIWKLRYSAEAGQFRDWFHENVRQNPAEAQRLFVDELLRPTLGDKFVTKSLRYVLLNLIPSLMPIPLASVFTGAADTFLLDRFLRPRTPKLMIDRLRGAFKVRAM